MPIEQARTIGVLIYEKFETLDVFGPIQMFGSALEKFQITTVAETCRQVTSRHGQSVKVDHTFADNLDYDLILVPGGPGTWNEIDNAKVLDWIRLASTKAEVVMSVCTGAALLAKAGVLENRAATTNKMEFDWVTQFGNNVDWQGRARWVGDGKLFTSSGVSAGMDMSLAVIEHLWDAQTAEESATHAEYVRQRDPDDDPFALHFDVE